MYRKNGWSCPTDIPIQQPHSRDSVLVKLTCLGVDEGRSSINVNLSEGEQIGWLLEDVSVLKQWTRSLI